MNTIANDVISAAAQGESEAFETIYKICCGYVYNAAYRVVGNQEDAQEVTQDVFLIIHKKLDTFRFDSAFKTWVYRITINTAINYAKRMSKHRKKTVEFNEEYMMSGRSNEVEEQSDKQFNQKVAASLLNVLNPDQRACIVLRSVEGLSYQEIADSLKININTVRTRIKRAREALLALRKEVVKNAM